MNQLVPRPVFELDRRSLHASLTDPVLEAVNYLNEAGDRYPHAISFAAGAPFPEFFDSLDVERYVATYVNYVVQEKGLSAEQVRRRLYQYGASRGLITELVARALELDLGVKIRPESVVITVGAQEAMFLVCRALRADARDVLGVVTPCYVGILGGARLLDFDVVGVGSGATGVELEELASACSILRESGRRMKALYVAPDFANPSGLRMTLETRTRLLELASDEGFLILEDATYRFTTEQGRALPTLKQMDSRGHVIYLGTFAKIAFPGARVGFVVAQQQVSAGPDAPKRLLADEVASLKTMVTVNTSPICQAAIAGLLLEFDCSLTVMAREKARFYRGNLALLLSALERHGRDGSLPDVSWNCPAGGFFVTLQVPVEVNAALLELSASDYGVLWTPMSNFYVGSPSINQIRLSCSSLIPEQIEEGIRRLASLIEDRVAELGVVSGNPARVAQPVEATSARG